MVTHGFLFLLVLGLACGETSNYVKQAISVTYEEEGLPTQGVLNGTVTELDTLSPRIVLNKTDAALNCSSGKVIVLALATHTLLLYVSMHVHTEFIS